MKILHISDTHGQHGKLILQNADVLCITGDESNNRSPHINHKEFLDFYSWLKRIRGKFKHVIMIPGNHSSWIFHNEGEAKQMLKEIDVYLLIGEEIVLDGIKFYGEPIVPTFGEWVYMTARHKLNKYWELIPEDVDVLLTHTPPKGILDLSFKRNHDIEMCGCGALNKKVKKLKQLKAHLFGHIHNNKRIENTGLLQRGNVVFSNATAITDGEIEKGVTFHGSLVNI